MKWISSSLPATETSQEKQLVTTWKWMYLFKHYPFRTFNPKGKGPISKLPCRAGSEATVTFETQVWDPDKGLNTN